MFTAEDHSLLDFESRSWLEEGPKDRQIEFELGLTSAAYYDRLLELIHDPDAYRADPFTIRRLSRMIEPAAGTKGMAG